MSMKLLQTFREGNQSAKLYRDFEWNEYRVKFYDSGILIAGADYHTDNRDDARATALESLRRGLVVPQDPIRARTRNPAPKSPRRVSQITGKPPSKRLKARRAKKHVPGYFPNPALRKLPETSPAWKQMQAEAHEIAGTRRGTSYAIEAARLVDARNINAAWMPEWFLSWNDYVWAKAQMLKENPAPRSPRRVSQITGKPPSARLKARRLKKRIPGYSPNPFASRADAEKYMRVSWQMFGRPFTMYQDAAGQYIVVSGTTKSTVAKRENWRVIARINQAGVITLAGERAKNPAPFRVPRKVGYVSIDARGGGFEYGADAVTPHTWKFTAAQPKYRHYGYALPAALTNSPAFRAWLKEHGPVYDGTLVHLRQILKPMLQG